MTVARVLAVFLGATEGATSLFLVTIVAGQARDCDRPSRRVLSRFDWGSRCCVWHAENAIFRISWLLFLGFYFLAFISWLFFLGQSFFAIPSWRFFLGYLCIRLRVHV